MRLATSLLILLAGCEVGSFPKGGAATDADTGSGSNTDGGMIDAPDYTACVDRAAAPEAAHVHSAAAGGGTHAGETCTQAACHAAGTNDPWISSGTVYKADGTTIQAGVLVRIKNGTGVPLRAVTDDAGNFHIQSLGQVVPFPTTVEVTACPDIKPMTTMLQNAGEMDCAKAGCHPKVTDPINFL